MPKIVLLLFISISFFACRQRELKKIPIHNGPVSIAYDLEGKGDTAIILVHGWSINKGYWEKQLPALAKRFTVIAPDLAGHGQSGHNRDQWTIENYAADISAIIDQLDLDKVILVGHSMGGEISLITALQNPGKVIGLIGIDNFKGFVQRYTPEQQSESKKFLDQLRLHFDSLTGIFVREGLFPPGSQDSISIQRVLRDARNENPEISVATLGSLIQVSLEDSARISHLKFPLHLIASDPPPDMDQLKKICKAGFSVRMIHGTGHYPMIEKPEEFNELLLMTLNDIAKGK
jgi:pimeloyl-ACP methyl ester carboxylesterase